MKYIFMDIDGTLFDHGTFSVPESACRAVEAAVKAGHKPFICTGRSCCMMDQVEQVPYAGIVAAAGAYVEVDGKILFEEIIEKPELEKITDCCESLAISYILEGNQGIYMHDGIRNYFASEEGRKKEAASFSASTWYMGWRNTIRSRKKYINCVYIIPR